MARSKRGRDTGRDEGFWWAGRRWSTRRPVSAGNPFEISVDNISLCQEILDSYLDDRWTDLRRPLFRPVVYSSLMCFTSCIVKVRQVPQILHFEPSLEALSLRSDVISSIKIFFLIRQGDIRRKAGARGHQELQDPPGTPHPTPYTHTLHPTPYTHTPYTLHPTPHTLHPRVAAFAPWKLTNLSAES